MSVPNRGRAFVTAIVDDTEVDRGDFPTIAKGEPRVERGLMVFLAEDIGALPRRRQGEIAVDAPQGVSDDPATKCQQSPDLVTSVSCADQRSKPYSRPAHVPAFRLGAGQADVLPQPVAQGRVGNGVVRGPGRTSVFKGKRYVHDSALEPPA